MQPDINRLIELQKLLLAFSQVDRMVHRKHADKFIKENDTEHSYNLGMTAWYLSRWFPDLNGDLIIQYALAHDLVEVYAGDTYIYGTSDELDSKSKREAEALKRLEQEWPDFEGMIKMIHAYEAKADAESRFVYALDKLMPIMLIYINDGYTWDKENITADMLHKAKIDKVKLSPEILPYFEQLHSLLLSKPELIRSK